MPATTIVEARAAQKALLHKLRHHRNVNGAGLVRYPDSGWAVHVNLVKPHKWWHRKLPGLWFGDVRVFYQVIGEVVAL